MSDDLVIDGAVTIPGAELRWSAVRSSGPGGQNVNKVATKVELRFDLVATRAIDEQVKARLRRIARGRLDARGRLRVSSQRTRNQERNLADAREKLAALVRQALAPPTPRKPTRPSPASRRRREEAKRRQATRKRARRGRDWDE